MPSPGSIDILWVAHNLPKDSLWDAPVPADSIDLLQGTLDLLILKTLSWGPTHGYGVARWIEQITGDVLHVEEGALYPALHRLEKREVTDSQSGPSQNNPPPNDYRLPPPPPPPPTPQTPTPPASFHPAAPP